MERKEYFILINRQLEDNYVFTNTVQYDVYLCVQLRNPHFHVETFSTCRNKL